MATNTNTCNTIRGLKLDACSPNIGGIKNIWHADYKEGAATITKEEGRNAEVYIG